MKRTAFPPRTSRRRLWAAIPVAACLALLLAVPAEASTVHIDDQANVLNATSVQNEAATLPVPIYIWITTQDAADKSTFDNDVRQKVSSEFPIVLGINTTAHHETLQIGSAAGLSQDAALAAESSANSAFDSVMRSRADYTGAVLGAVGSLRSSLANRGGGAGARTASHGPGLVLGILVLVVLVVVMALLGRLFRGYQRNQRMSGPPLRYGGGYGGGYGPPPDYGPGYGPGYGGYGPGYGGGYGGGMGRGAAAGLGAVGGGLLGYELGKMAGENEQFRRDEMYGDQGGGNQDQNYGDQGGGDWTVGQDSDWGGGGGDSGGGDQGGGGGDW